MRGFGRILASSLALMVAGCAGTGRGLVANGTANAPLDSPLSRVSLRDRIGGVMAWRQTNPNEPISSPTRTAATDLPKSDSETKPTSATGADERSPVAPRIQARQGFAPMNVPDARSASPFPESQPGGGLATRMGRWLPRLGGGLLGSKNDPSGFVQPTQNDLWAESARQQTQDRLEAWRSQAKRTHSQVRETEDSSVLPVAMEVGTDYTTVRVRPTPPPTRPRPRDVEVASRGPMMARAGRSISRNEPNFGQTSQAERSISRNEPNPGAVDETPILAAAGSALSRNEPNSLESPRPARAIEESEPETPLPSLIEPEAPIANPIDDPIWAKPAETPTPDEAPAPASIPEPVVQPEQTAPSTPPETPPAHAQPLIPNAAVVAGTPAPIDPALPSQPIAPEAPAPKAVAVPAEEPVQTATAEEKAPAAASPAQAQPAEPVPVPVPADDPSPTPAAPVESKPAAEPVPAAVEAGKPGVETVASQTPEPLVQLTDTPPAPDAPAPEEKPAAALAAAVATAPQPVAEAPLADGPITLPTVQDSPAPPAAPIAPLPVTPTAPQAEPARPEATPQDVPPAPIATQQTSFFPRTRGLLASARGAIRSSFERPSRPAPVLASEPDPKTFWRSLFAPATEAAAGPAALANRQPVAASVVASAPVAQPAAPQPEAPKPAPVVMREPTNLAADWHGRDQLFPSSYYTSPVSGRPATHRDALLVQTVGPERVEVPGAAAPVAPTTETRPASPPARRPRLVSRWVGRLWKSDRAENAEPQPAAAPSTAAAPASNQPAGRVKIDVPAMDEFRASVGAEPGDLAKNRWGFQGVSFDRFSEPSQR